MSNGAAQPPKVFISYSWDSEAHQNRVLDLANRLRRDGIDCNIDLYETSPQVGWPRWMSHQINKAQFVLVVCTETYQKRFTGQEELGKGKGVNWEGTIINQYLYDQIDNNKFSPVIFAPQDAPYIPVELRRITFHVLDEQGYERLYRQLTAQPLNKKPEIGSIRLLPPLEEKLVQTIPIEGRDRQENADLASDRQRRLNELYNDVRRKYYKSRDWSAVINIFGQMQPDFFDPDGLYRQAREELRKQQKDKEQLRKQQEQKIQEIKNLYQIGNDYFQNNKWYEAQQCFGEILHREPNGYRETVRRLEQIQQKQQEARWIALAVIVFCWLITIPLDNLSGGGTPLTGAIGGGSSGVIIWWLSQQRQSTGENRRVQFLLFCFVGLILGGILKALLQALTQDMSLFNGLDPILTACAGAMIAIGLLFWQYPVPKQHL
jgi:tetratricopeptide (TPR) repeat protein